MYYKFLRQEKLNGLPFKDNVLTKIFFYCDYVDITTKLEHEVTRWYLETKIDLV